MAVQQGCEMLAMTIESDKARSHADKDLSALGSFTSHQVLHRSHITENGDAWK